MLNIDFLQNFKNYLVWLQQRPLNEQYIHGILSLLKIKRQYPNKEITLTSLLSVLEFQNVVGTDLEINFHPVHQEKDDRHDHQAREAAITDFGDQFLVKIIVKGDL